MKRIIKYNDAWETFTLKVGCAYKNKVCFIVINKIWRNKYYGHNSWRAFVTTFTKWYPKMVGSGIDPTIKSLYQEIKENGLKLDKRDIIIIKKEIKSER